MEICHNSLFLGTCFFQILQDFGKRTDLTSGKFPEVDRQQTRDVVSKFVGVSHGTLSKDFSSSKRAEIAKIMVKEVSIGAQERMLSGKPSSNLDKGRTDVVVAKYVGVGKDTLRKDLALAEAVEKNPEKTKDNPLNSLVVMDAALGSVSRFLDIYPYKI